MDSGAGKDAKGVSPGWVGSAKGYRIPFLQVFFSFSFFFVLSAYLVIASMDGIMPPLLRSGEDPAQNDRYVSSFSFFLFFFLSNLGI